MNAFARIITAGLSVVAIAFLSLAVAVSATGASGRIYDGTAGDGIDHRTEAAFTAEGLVGTEGMTGEAVVSAAYEGTGVDLPGDYAFTEGSTVAPMDAVPGDLVVMDYGTTTGVYVGHGEAVVVRNGAVTVIDLDADLTTFYVSVDL